jgi:aspartokinase
VGPVRGANARARARQVGVPGVASAIFGTIRDAAANVIMISQASSEHSVCFAVKQAQGEQAVAALNARCAEPCAVYHAPLAREHA